MPRQAPPTLVHVLLAQAAERPEQVAFEYLHEDGRIDSLTYRDLLGRAAATARRLRAEGDGGPALLLYPPGLDFVTALWGCFLAGVPAVPAYPPLFGPADRVTQRLARVVADSRATTLMADPLLLHVLTPSGMCDPLPPVLTAEPGELPGPDDPSAVTPAPEDVALIQYTSGTTKKPRGVILEHRNLMSNIAAITELFGLDGSTRAVSWLPPYHDMGLIGFILTPVYGGFPARLMSPMQFLKNPLAWLRQIAALGVTHTGGPNFGYDLCVRRARAVELSDLDLSSWRVAFNGSEPVRRGTLTAFADRFAANGFRPSAFLPCYGLAEATLIVTGRHWSPTDAVNSAGGVDCGPAIAGHEIAVVNVDTGALVTDAVEGEIWVRGPSVTRGYWNGTSELEDSLYGMLEGRRFLRTGDLGYLQDGHLHVTGRLKDVLVQRGLNYHAHDLESAAVEGNPALRPIAAAFTVDDGSEQIMLAVEQTGRDGADPEALAADVRERVLAVTGALVDTVIVCHPHTIPRTTSGKVQRCLARHRHRAGELGGHVSRLRSGDAATEPLELFLAAVFAAVCNVPGCGRTQSLSSIGGDSMCGAEIAAIVEDALHLPVPLESVLSAQSPRKLTARLLQGWASDGVAGRDVADRIRRLSSEGPEDRGMERLDRALESRSELTVSWRCQGDSDG